MSAKINKNGKEYPIGVIPQNVIEDVAELKNAFKTVTGTMSNVLDTNVYVPFPTGFNASNSVIIGYCCNNSSNDLWYSNYAQITVLSDDSSGVRIKTSDTNFLSQPFKVTLMKIS